MTLELYSHWLSTRCTMVHLLDHHLGAKLNIREISVFPLEYNMRDHIQACLNVRTMERINFLSGNSGIRVPLLVVDDNKVISNAKDILKYVAEKYCEDDHLYPVEKRDDIDTQLNFVVDKLDVLFSDVYYELAFRKESEEVDSPDSFDKLNEALKEYEEFINDNDFICGPELTLVDFCLCVIAGTLEGLDHNMSSFPKIMNHLSKCKEVIKGWDEVGGISALKYGKWYKVAIKAAESGGCPYFPKPHNAVNITASYSSDVELYTHSLLTKGIMIELLARSLELELVIKKIDLCYKEENAESRKETDENWTLMMEHSYFSDDENGDAPPMLVDQGKVVYETGNILKHLVEMYGTEEQRHQLYPFDLDMSNVVEERLSSDLDVLDPLVLETYTQCFESVSTKLEVDQTKVAKIQEALGNIEDILQHSDFIAGNDLTIADYAFAVTLSVLTSVDPDIVSGFERVSLYLKNCKEIIKGWDDVGQSGSDLLGEWYRDCLKWTENGDCPYYKG